MLTIRREQVEAFTASLRERFEERMVAHVAAEHPRRRAALGERGTRAFVADAIALGERKGIDTEGALALLVDLAAEFGLRFERAPDGAWARRVLDHGEMPGELKVIVIRERFAARTGGRRLVVQEGME